MHLAALLFAVLTFCCASPANAHVKWFLEHDESELLTQAKPDIFMHPSIENVSIIAAAMAFFALAAWCARRFANNAINLKLIGWSNLAQNWVSLIMGIFTGGLMLY